MMNDRSDAYAALGSKRIDLNDDDGLHFWVREFGVSAAELRGAVLAVGSSARLVGLYLEDVASRPTTSRN
jgi:hypothetical protein